jgi:hypothetical protein
MKKALLTLAALAVAGVSALASDGTVTFANFTTVANNADAGKTYQESTLSAAWNVGLFLGNQVGNNAATPLATTTIFGAGTQADPATGLFQYNGPDIALTGSAPGQTAVVTVKAWRGGSSFATALNRGEVSFTTLALGGPNPTPPPPAFTSPQLDNMPVLVTHDVPEPTTFALGFAGLAGLAMIRRRK